MVILAMLVALELAWRGFKWLYKKTDGSNRDYYGNLRSS